MFVTSFLPLAGVVLVTVGVRRVQWHRLPPRVALWALTSLAIAGAGAVLAATAVLAGGFALGTPMGQWVVQACSLFVAHHRVPLTVGVVSTSLLVMMGWRIGATVAAVRSERPACDGPLTVVDATAPIAFARSGRRGGVVVSTGMLDALEPAERRVLFAHERAHVRGRHDLHLLVHRLAVAIVPWFGAMTEDVRLATERAADAAALSEVDGDRRLVATAIARAARAADRHGAVAPTLAFNGGAVGFRVQSMLQPVGGVALPASAIGVLGLAGAVAVTVFLHHLAILLVHICLS